MQTGAWRRVAAGTMERPLVFLEGLDFEAALQRVSIDGLDEHAVRRLMAAGEPAAIEAQHQHLITKTGSSGGDGAGDTDTDGSLDG